MKTVIKRINRLDKELVTLLFQKANDGKDINPTPAFFKDAHNIMLVSYTDGVPSGFLWAYVLDDLKTPYPKMLLYSIDVFGDYRRHGIATRLIEAAKKLAKLNGCSKIIVPTTKSNQPATNLYRKTGGKIENDDDVLFIYDRVALSE